ncbi:YbaB/EbfC family nucleoid-associated protein [Kribbella sp. NPDC003557]|uniref:YbaB/EbfC family nucleoid-associated protein n=1 Tax=Kribbella sp. NPDC003557 TaxID=3154449 RepID=UPI0033B89A64
MDMSKLYSGQELAALGLDDGLERLTAAAVALDRAFDEVTVTAVSPDRMVKVTVTGRGDVREMEFDPGIYRTENPQALAATILATLGQAHAAAAAKMQAAYESFQEDLDD